MRTMPAYYNGVAPVIEHDHGSAPGLLKHSEAKPRLPKVLYSSTRQIRVVVRARVRARMTYSSSTRQSRVIVRARVKARVSLALTLANPLATPTPTPTPNPNPNQVLYTEPSDPCPEGSAACVHEAPPLPSNAYP